MRVKANTQNALKSFLALLLMVLLFVPVAAPPAQEFSLPPPEVFEPPATDAPFPSTTAPNVPAPNIPELEIPAELQETADLIQSGAATAGQIRDFARSVEAIVNDPVGFARDQAIAVATDIAVNAASDIATQVFSELDPSIAGELLTNPDVDTVLSLVENIDIEAITEILPELGPEILSLVDPTALFNVFSELPLDAAAELLSSIPLESLTELPLEFLSTLSADLLALLPPELGAAISSVTGAAGAGGCCSCLVSIVARQFLTRSGVETHISAQSTGHRQWLLDTFLKQQVLPALMKFTEQMSAVAMHQTMIFGTFLDAKHQLETQRLVQELHVEAHKDYQPSEDFCYFGTNARSLANSEAKSNFNAYMLSRRQMGRHLGQYNVGGALGPDEDKLARWDQFKEQFCDPKDNNWLSSQPASGMALACGPSGASAQEFTNADIDYTKLVETPRTIGLLSNGFRNSDFVPDAAGSVSEFGDTAPNISNAAIMALGNNLYGHNVLARPSRQNLRRKEMQNLYMALRSVAAKRSVAENSFNSIVSMKSAGTTDNNSATADTWQFLGAVLKELGIPENEIQGMIGQEPSYYAQLEVLGKKIYQSPNFFSNLYDKPANIKRKAVAMKAIELMLDRAIYESQLRQEMIGSVLLSSRLREPFKEAEQQLQGGQ